jgi:two-component system nitrate/nitrite response regulator NarL
MHPATVWGRPGWRCDRHHTFGTIFDTKTRDGRQAADVLAEHDIGPTNDTRRGVRTAVPERRLLLASVVWEQSLDKRPLPFWCSGALGQWVGVMGSRLAIIIVESRLLVREALKSLMQKNAYRVVCDIGSTAEISGASTLSDEPKLVILGAQSADNALTEAVSARKLWPDSKIILLYEYLLPADFQKLLTSEINGCVPLLASPDTLISMLDMIVTRDVRVMVVGDIKHPAIQPAQPEDSNQSVIKIDKLRSDGAEHEDVVPPLRNHPGLSEREAQMLDGLVKGHPNKVIARTCDITEATVKVHMKSILRKIRVRNRTQAAIWAMENGYAADGFNGRLLNPDSARNAAAITEAAIRSVATNRGPFSEYT